jgi:hypothetical protein
MFERVAVWASEVARGKWGTGIFALLGFSAQCLAVDIQLGWKASADPNAVGYNLYYGVSSGHYTNMVPAGASTNALVHSLVPGTTYYFAATSYDALGLEGLYSQETSYTVPVPPPVLPVQSNRSITVLTTLSVINTATDSVPTNVVTYQLMSAPSGSSISSSGIINWTPTLAQSPSTNLIVTVVRDSGVPQQSATNSFTVFVSGPYDGINLTDPTQALADLDRDGLSNLAEYALGTDPRNAADPRSGIQFSVTNSSGSEYVLMQFKERVDVFSIPLSYVPEVSSDGQTWYSDNGHVGSVSVVPLDSQFNWVTVKDLTPATSVAPQFIRLRIVEN